MKKILPLLILLSSCLGIGDVFRKKKRIQGNYYLVETENGDYDVAYESDDVYESRSPAGVIAYGSKDSVLVLRIKPFNSEIFYYALNLNKGFSARKEDYEMGKVLETNFQNSWLKKLDVKFIEVK